MVRDLARKLENQSLLMIRMRLLETLLLVLKRRKRKKKKRRRKNKLCVNDILNFNKHQVIRSKYVFL